MADRRPTGTVPLEALLEHRAWVRGLARSLVADPNDADDVEQETWRMALERPPRHAGSLRAWFGTVVRNAASAVGRGRGRRRRLLEAAAAGTRDAAPPEDVVAEAEIQARLVRAVLDLAEPYRTTVLQRYFHGLEASAIAARTETPVETVRTRLKRGVALLRERMGRELGEDREAWGLLLFGDRRLRAELPRAAAPAGAAALAGGGLAMAIGGKLVAGAAVAAAVALGWWLWPGPPAGTGPGPGGETASAGGSPLIDGAKDPAREEAPPAEPPAGGARFAGRVLNPAGAPVGGAVVGATELRPAEAMTAVAPARAQGASAADGSFELLLPEGTARADVVVSAPGYAVACVERARAGTPVEVRLRREGVLSGRVLDPEGSPVPGAVVRAFRVLGHEHVDGVAATTGPDGAYRLGGFDACATERIPEAPMRRPFLDVRAAGFGGVQAGGPFPGPGEELRRDLVLFPARPLEVLVTDADGGEPLEGATVTLGLHATGLQVQVPGDRGRILPHPAPYLAEGRTGADGRCLLEGAPGRLAPYEQLVVRVWRKGHTAEFVILRGRRPAGDDQVEVRLWPAVTARGRVVDPSGNAVPGAWVIAGPDTGSWFPAPFGDLPWLGGVRTDAGGRYALPCIAASADGSRSVRVATWGSMSPTGDGKLFTTQQQVAVEVRPRTGEDAVAPDLVLPEPRPARVARFVIVDTGGAPVPDALISSLSDAARNAPIRTDDGGEALLLWASEINIGHGVEPEPTLLVAAPGFARTAVRCRPEMDGVPEVRVVLAPGLRIEGRVVEPDGTPFAAASVFAQGEGVEGSTVSGPAAESGPDGSFVFEDLPAHPFRVTASTARGYDPAARVVQVEGVLPGGPPLECVLPPSRVAFGTVVATIVAEEDGSPLVEGLATVLSDPGTPNALPDGGTPGVVTMTRVPAGTWSVRAWARGRLAASAVAVVPGGGTVRLRFALARGTPVAVTATGLPDLRERGIPGARALRVDGAPGEAGAGESGHGIYEGGAWRFDALRPGRYVLVVNVRGSPWEETAPKGEVYVSPSPFEVGPPGRDVERAAVRLVHGGTLSVGIEDPEVPQPVPPRRSMSGGGAGGDRAKDPVDPEAEERIRVHALEHSASLEVLGADGARWFLAVGVSRGPQDPIPLPPGEYVVRLHLPSGGIRDATASLAAGGRAMAEFGGR